MVPDTLENRAGGKDALDPHRIARHPLLTAREKVDLLRRLKAEVTTALGSDHDPGISPAEVDAAIEEVRLGAQRGEQTGFVRQGDN